MSDSKPQLDRRSYELTIINEIARALNGSIDLNQALHTTLNLVATLLDLQTGWIWLLNEETGASYLAAEQNLPPALSQNPLRMEGSCYCLDAYRAGEMEGVANINVVSCSRLKNLIDDTNGLTFHASIPLYAHGNQLGILNVASSDWRELSPDDLRLLHTVGDMVGIAIERTRLFEQSQQLGMVNERNRLAREIHDTLAQGLVAISLQLETADALLDVGTPLAEDPGQIKDLITRSLQITQENLAEARRSVMDLRATPLDGRTLTDALQNLADQVAADSSFKIALHSIGRDIPLSVQIETGLYRIAQEALTNVHRHAQAQSVNIELSTMSSRASLSRKVPYHISKSRDGTELFWGTIQLTIRDDGIGFDPDIVSQNRYGLVGMNERANLLGGHLHIESAHGAGTQIVVQVPLQFLAE